MNPASSHAAHIEAMNAPARVLTIDAKLSNEANVALPFTTEAEIVAAWNWLLAGNRLSGFSYRPDSEGVDTARMVVKLYLTRPALELPPLDAAHIEALLGSLYGADLNFAIRTLISPAA